MTEYKTYLETCKNALIDQFLSQLYMYSFIRDSEKLMIGTDVRGAIEKAFSKAYADREFVEMD